MTTESKEKKEEKTGVPAVAEKEITASVLARVHDMQEKGQLKVPKDYSPENALKSAYLILVDMKANDKPVLSGGCNTTSIAQALLKMVVQGLNPMKHQCAFIPYKDELTCVREYQGSIAMAKRVGMKEINAQIVYEGDTFKYEILPNGTKNIIEHKQEIQNIDITKIKGAYAVVKMNDDTTTVEIMSMAQIKTAWNQGAMKGNSPAHKNFTDQMCLKTVINRACKPIINSSDDAYLYGENDDELDPVRKEIENKANIENLEITPHTEIKDPEPPVNEAGSEKQPEPEQAGKRKPSFQCS